MTFNTYTKSLTALVAAVVVSSGCGGTASPSKPPAEKRMTKPAMTVDATPTTVTTTARAAEKSHTAAARKRAVRVVRPSKKAATAISHARHRSPASLLNSVVAHVRRQRNAKRPQAKPGLADRVLAGGGLSASKGGTHRTKTSGLLEQVLAEARK
jgi:hypothetical protein